MFDPETSDALELVPIDAAEGNEAGLWSVNSVDSCIAACLNDNNCDGFVAASSIQQQCSFLSELPLLVDVEDAFAAIVEALPIADVVFATADCTKVATTDSDGSTVPTTAILFAAAGSMTATAVTIAVV